MDIKPLMYDLRKWGKKKTEEKYENVNTKTCENCGQLFVPYHGSTRQRFCTPKCRVEYDKLHKDEINAKLRDNYRKKQSDRADTNWYGNKMLADGTFVARPCAICGKKIIPKSPSEKYCGTECKIEAQRRSARAYYKRKVEAKKNEKTKEITNMNVLNTSNTNFNSNSGNTYGLRRPMRRPHYTTEDYNRKIRNKTRRIIDTLRQLDKAKLDEDLIFEAINNLNRMSLNDFEDAKE